MARKTSTAEAEWVEIDSIAPWENNPRRNDEAVPAVADSIRRFGWGNPILVRREDRTVIAGHTRLKAARSLGMTAALVRWMDVTEQEAHALALADNRTGELAEWDEDKLQAVLKDLSANEVDLGGLGWDPDELQNLLDGLPGDEDGATYTSKVKAPIYTPKGDRPPLTDLFDRTKTRALLDEIDRADLPDGLAAFLRLAAERHTGFNFKAIAEFYCHASPDVQRLMESSGLVIIDFGRAIEEGFVKVTNSLGALADKEELLRGGPDEADDA